MPELPEVETVARGVNKRVRGDRIVDVWLGSHKEPFKSPAAKMAKALEGRAILGVRRAGKHIVVELSLASSNLPNGSSRRDVAEAEPEAQWIVHLGMTGQLLITTPESPVAAHTHARLTLQSGRELRFVDAMVKRHGLENHEIGFDAKWIRDNVDRILWTLEEPPLAMPAFAQYREAVRCGGEQSGFDPAGIERGRVLPLGCTGFPDSRGAWHWRRRPARRRIGTGERPRGRTARTG